MDDKLKAYAETIYEQSLHESVQILTDERADYFRQVAAQKRAPNLPFSGADLQAIMRLYVQHIERCMEAKLESYRKAFNEVQKVPTEKELSEILQEVEDTQKLQINQSSHALQHFMKSHGIDGDLKGSLAPNGARGHDRVLQKWKIWRGEIQLKKPPRADDQEFARMAIDEARKSLAEADARLHPKVGAVVVKDGRVLSAAHRGESPGCHAEYIALEEKLRNTPVAGATVYTTLEPCTTRNHPKIPCALRLVERRVARVVIGMLDPNPAITGKGQRALRKARITTDFFPSALMDEVEELNREFTRTYEAQGGDVQEGMGLETNPPQALEALVSSDVTGGAAAPEQKSAIRLAIKSAVYSRDFGGVAIVAELDNPTANHDQVTDWSLKIRDPGTTLRGGPGRATFLCGAPWWPSTPFDLEAKKMTRGAVFFPCDATWTNALPTEPLRGRLIAHLFLSTQVEEDVEIYSMKRLQEWEAKPGSQDESAV